MSVTQRQLAKQAVRLAGLALFLGTLPGCQSIAGSPSLSQVRIIDASPDAPGLDIYQGGAIVVYNLGFGTVTSYDPITPGTYPIASDAAGSRQQLTTATGTFNVNGQYTVIVGNYAAALQETILQDQAQAAPSGEAAFRFLDQAPAIGPLDLYLVVSGGTLMTSKPIATNITFGTNSGYINVPAGTYSIVALPTGTVPVSTTASTYSGAAVIYPGGAVRTVVLINQGLVTSPGLTAIVADDFD
jgi:hypothetical protein